MISQEKHLHFNLDLNYSINYLFTLYKSNSFKFCNLVDNLFIYFLNLNIPQINSESKAKFDDPISPSKILKAITQIQSRKSLQSFFFSSAFHTASLSVRRIPNKLHLVWLYLCQRPWSLSMRMLSTFLNGTIYFIRLIKLGLVINLWVFFK